MTGRANGRRRPPTRRRSTRPPGGRLVVVLVILVLGFAGILVRLFVLQVAQASSLQSLARSQRLHHIPLPATRGTIYDRQGRELAMSVPAKAVFVDPSLVTDPGSEAEAIARVLGLEQADVYADVTRTTVDGHANRFAYIAHGVLLGQAAELQKLHLDGVGFQDESRRLYPQQDVAAQVLGVVGMDGTGLEGLEYQYQPLLAGRPGDEAVQEDVNGTLIPQAGQSVTPPVAGSNLVLTIDSDIQYRAQLALAQDVRRNHAHGGTIIVMDPHSGQVLAMASYPTFNPNTFGSFPSEDRENRAVTASYEPGSVNKVIGAAAALETKSVSVNDRFTVPDAMQIYDHVFHDAEPHPTRIMNLADILAYSSNIGMIEIAENRLTPGLLSSYLHSFGLGARTGVGFPGEASGILPPAGTWSGTSVPTIAIGQGVAVTPLQMACVYATVANGGVWVQPSLVRGTVDASGTYRPAASPATRRVISASTASQLTRMLAYAVDVGTGQQAQIPGFWVAGKTGTARIPLPQGGGYYTDRYEASFIGFAPAASPAIEVAVVIDAPKTVFGGIAAAPLFQEVERFALARMHVPPASRLPVPTHLVPTG